MQQFLVDMTLALKNYTLSILSRLPGRIRLDLRLFSFLILEVETLNFLAMVQIESPLFTVYQ